jgi:hypothetical protein
MCRRRHAASGLTVNCWLVDVRLLELLRSTFVYRQMECAHTVEIHGEQLNNQQT